MCDIWHAQRSWRRRTSMRITETRSRDGHTRSWMSLDLDFFSWEWVKGVVIISGDLDYRKQFFNGLGRKILRYRTIGSQASAKNLLLIRAAELSKDVKMWIFGAIFKNPEDFAHLLKLKMASVAANRAIPSDPNWAFCYQILGRTCRSFSIVLQQLSPNLRNAVSTCIPVLALLQCSLEDGFIEGQWNWMSTVFYVVEYRFEEILI